jgi:hypothetical protein
MKPLKARMKALKMKVKAMSPNLSLSLRKATSS